MDENESVKLNNEQWQFIHGIHELAAALFDMGLEYQLEISPVAATFSLSHQSHSASSKSDIDISVYRSGEYALWHAVTGRWKGAMSMLVGSADCTLDNATRYLSVVWDM